MGIANHSASAPNRACLLYTSIYVATAKKEVFGKVAIDMIAGPSEVLILADGTANPVYAAADLLSQAEHDEMAMPILVTTDADFGGKVITEVYRQIEADLGRKEIARKSVDNYGFVFVAENLEQAFELSNAIAPEHMEILLPEPMQYLERVRKDVYKRQVLCLSHTYRNFVKAQFG